MQSSVGPAEPPPLPVPVPVLLPLPVWPASPFPAPPAEAPERGIALLPIPPVQPLSAARSAANAVPARRCSGGRGECGGIESPWASLGGSLLSDREASALFTLRPRHDLAGRREWRARGRR